ncbi:hypothetical protein [Gimesia maris]|uniref:hypothetical protein n=1 Tax=Gimesia maris TaxID=122 RepID=UPI0032EEEDF9
MNRNKSLLRELPSVTLDNDRVTKEFRKFAMNRLIQPLGVISGYKQDEKTEVAIQIVSNLLLAGQRCRTVADTRDYHQPGATLRIPIWDAIVNAGYAQTQKGSEVSKKVTRFYATRKLLDLFTEWELWDTITQDFNRGSIMSPSEYNLVVLRPTKNKRDPNTGEILTRAHRRKKPERIPSEFAEWVDQVEDQLDFINRQNFKHSWQVTVHDHNGKPRIHQPGVTLQQQHVGEFMRCKRLYTPGRWGAQQLSKEVRQTMLIDGKPVAELDFKSSVLRLLYHLADEDTPHQDLYSPDLLLPNLYKRCTDSDTLASARTLVKKLSIIVINTKSQIAAFKALEKWISENNQSGIYDLILGREGISTEQFVQSFIQVHRPISRYFFRSIGQYLISLESTIMQNICLKLAVSGEPCFLRPMNEDEQKERMGKLIPGLTIVEYDGIPVLPIHDAIVVKTIDTDFAEYVMAEEYRGLMFYNPVIEREF